MGIVVGIVVVIVLAMIVADTAGGGGQKDMTPYQGMDMEDLAEFEDFEELEDDCHRHDQYTGPELADPDYFDRLMTPGSDEDAWHNAALDEGYDPEDW